MKNVRKILLLYSLLATVAVADTTTVVIGWDHDRYRRPDGGYTVGLALSGGGARGMSQIGVLLALEEADIGLGAIAGTSIGGIIGGLYAAGYSADDLDTMFSAIDFNALFSNRPSRTSMFTTQRPEKERYVVSIRFDGIMPHIPKALTSGQVLSDLMLRYTLKPNYLSGGDFSRLKIPYRAVTTDIVSGKEIVLAGGNLADALRSTMAFPLAFTGVETDDRILMDGGMLNPIPVDIVADLDPTLDMYIAVNTTSDLLAKDQISDPIDIANQVTTIMSMDKKEQALASADIVIAPDIAEYTAADFDRCDSLIQRGYEAGRRAVPEIKNRLDQIRAGDSLVIERVTVFDAANSIDAAAFSDLAGRTIQRRILKELIRNRYRTLGLFTLSVNVITDDIRQDQQHAVRLDIIAVPQPNLAGLAIEITGNTMVPDSLLLDILNGTGSHLTAEHAAVFCDSVVAIYNANGYDLAHVSEIRYAPADNRLDIVIDEVTIEEIRITGNRRTKNWLIKSHFKPQPGQPLNLRNARTGVANIYSTDLFDRVIMNVLPGDSGAVIHLNVEEKKYTQIRLGWHWDDEYYSEEFVELLDDNLFGTGQECLLHAQYAPRRQKYEAALKADRFFSTYLTYRIRGYYNLLERKFYNDRSEEIHSIREERLGIDFVAGQQISRFGTVTGEIRWENIDTRTIATGVTGSTRLRTITLRSHVETINKYPFPTHGKRHMFYVEFAADVLGGETRYTKLFSSVESYFPLLDWLNFHPKIALGWVDTDYLIPVSERFYLGGQNSFAGYNTDEVSGDKMVLGNLEFRFRLPCRFYLTARYDMGQVYTSADAIKLNNLRWGAGAFLAYDSPIGPIDFGYGITEDKLDRVYFSVGLDF